MISTADALELMAVVAACHPRTAPRVDDREAAIATATIWVELLDEYDFTKPELIAAVKTRAKSCSDAPEVADIIRVARLTRNDHLARTVNITPRDEQPPHYPGDAKAAQEAPYPPDWDSDKRLSTYWYAIRMHAIPRSTKGWEALAEQREREAERRDESA